LYLGEVITMKEVEAREASADYKDSYYFDLDKFMPQIRDEDEDDELSAGMRGAKKVVPEKEQPFVIDGRHCGNIARFINHSCDPNLDVFAVAGERRDGKVYNIALFTNRDVKAGEELTFSYSERHPKMLDSKQAGKDYTPCRCGAKDCVGYVF
jgi:histone-lysine N-methyltransferase SUV39H